ncbi:DUF2256 domain-containing protein [Vibrio sp. AH4]|uniref:DUF2256 domain-containing protein n=1 Tax=Vibrio sp. AH4 TaxID=2919577 RepID=UPI00273A2B2B|nr:DUF2256 domain-containing protein [Vibrio sp. AH4]MDP4492825.1 DUF2256 domain-containing protein [Vibrio sp. AH4]
MASHKKAHLVHKICPVCLRSFVWRKKWQRCWAEVTYCSERCRRNRSGLTKAYANS